jgi:hypothetical protein
VALAQANNDANSADTIGLVTETIANNQEGFVTDSGIVTNINTTGSLQGETWIDGDVLYLSGTVAGRLTKVKPQAPIHGVIVGFVIHAHATQGKIYVKVDNGYELDELHNVRIVSPTNNQILQYTSATGLWENKTASFASGTVTSVSGTGSYGGLSLTGTVTSSGSLTFGGTPTGTWPIGVTGNAGTVTNGVYTTGDQTIAGIKIFSSSVDAPSFRDSANTAYYLDPANTSISMAVAGKVGVGTVSPSAMLTIVDGTGSTSDANSVAITSNYSTSTARRGGISWNDGTQAVSAISTVYNGATVDMVFGSLYNGAYNTTERMRITGAGNVGIGTSSPSFRLTTNYTAPATFTNAVGDFTQMWQAGGTNALGVAFSTSNTYARFVVNNGYKFAWNSASTDLMTLSEGGTLAVAGTVDATSFRDNANTAYYLDPANTGTSMVVAGDIVASNLKTSANTALSLGLSAGTAFSVGGSAISLRGSTTGYNDYGMEFYAGGSERMRIASNGKVLIGAGATASLGKLVVSEASSGTAVIALESQGSWNSQISATSAGNMIFNNGGTQRMSIDASGNVIASVSMYAPIFYDSANTGFYLDANNTGTSLNVAGSIVAAGNVTAYSDIRVKDNVENITDAIGKLNQIRGVTYTRTDLDDKERKYAGVIAQEIEQVLPEAVFDNGKVKAVDYNATIALLIEAVKEQQGQINELKLTIEQLKGK